MDIVIIIIIIGLFAYILFGKKPEVKKKYEILYGLEKNDLIPGEKQILEEKKKLLKVEVDTIWLLDLQLKKII